MSQTKGKITRRRFFSTIGWISLVPFAWAAARMGGTTHRMKSASKLSLPFPESDGVFFYDRVILVREKGDLQVLSSRCTHLGCAIREQDGDVLLCPCHGSRYDLTGKVIKGPASSALTALKWEREGGNVIVQL